MKIKLNGESREVRAPTIAALLEELDAPKIGVAIALNEQVVRKAEHASTPLREGDAVELIRAVQGG